MSPFFINGLKFVQTSIAFPEQYDVFSEDKQVGYVRLRNGVLTVDYPDVHGHEILSHEFNEPENQSEFGDTALREKWLAEIAAKIMSFHQRNQTQYLIQHAESVWLPALLQKIENAYMRNYCSHRYTKTGPMVVDSVTGKTIIRLSELMPVGLPRPPGRTNQIASVSVSLARATASQPVFEGRNEGSIALRNQVVKAVSNEKVDVLQQLLDVLGEDYPILGHDYTLESSNGHLTISDRIHIEGLVFRVHQDLRYFDLVVEPKVPTVSLVGDGKHVACWELETPENRPIQAAFVIKPALNPDPSKVGKVISAEEFNSSLPELLRLEFKSRESLNAAMLVLEDLSREWTHQERELTKDQRLD